MVMLGTRCAERVVLADRGVEELFVDGIRLDKGGIELWGKASRVGSRDGVGIYQCLANVGGALCRIEIGVREVPYPLLWEGDQA